jgi:lipoprotein-anchoring transpeptidase ErfK/SrfK
MDCMDNYRRKDDPNLVKIIVVLLVIAGIGAGVWALARRLPLQALTGGSAVAAAESFQAAQAMYSQGDLQGARAELAALVPRVRDARVAPQALLLLAGIEKSQGRYEDALRYLDQALDDYPNAPEQPLAAIAYARVLEHVGQFDEAVERFETISRTASPQVRAPALSGLARHAERQRRWMEARDLFRSAVQEAPWDSDAWSEAIEGMGRANVAVIFSPHETPDSKTHVVVAGDSITSIGNALNTTQALLIRANELADPTKLNIGQRLKYTPKDFRIVIERSTCRLYLLDKDGIFKRYSTGLGRPGKETTLGRYKIGNKQVDPTWFKPGFGPIPPGDPENELGTRWMPLVPVDEGLPTDLGIHGTIAPPTIGQYASSGCPRLYKEDVEELYDLVVRATPVDIVEVFDPTMLSDAAAVDISKAASP